MRWATTRKDGAGSAPCFPRPKIRSDDAERLQSAQWSAQWGNHRCEAGGVQSRPPETEGTLVAQNINGQL